jgi:hypothetical protein
VDAETKESTRKTEEKLDGRYKEGNLNERQQEDRKQWSLGVGQRRKTFRNRYIYIYIYRMSWGKCARLRENVP